MTFAGAFQTGSSGIFNATSPTGTFSLTRPQGRDLPAHPGRMCNCV